MKPPIKKSCTKCLNSVHQSEISHVIVNEDTSLSSLAVTKGYQYMSQKSCVINLLCGIYTNFSCPKLWIVPVLYRIGNRRNQLHVGMYFASCLCNYFWGTFSYTVHILNQKSYSISHFKFSYVCTIASFGVLVTVALLNWGGVTRNAGPVASLG